MDKVWVGIQIILFLDEVILWWIMYTLESKVPFEVYEAITMVILVAVSVYEVCDLITSVRAIQAELEGA